MTTTALWAPDGNPQFCLDEVRAAIRRQDERATYHWAVKLIRYTTLTAHVPVAQNHLWTDRIRIAPQTEARS